MTLWKGKEREEPPSGMDTEELNPIITYRHLLSSGLGVRNPLRVIGLCDMDAFYATCEQVRLNMDPSVPLVVRQWDSLIAINYPARAYGISRMDKVTSALERCPHLQVVHVATFDPAAPDAKPTYTDNPNSETHKVSLDFYRKESKKIMEVFKEVLSDAEVERASIDEAFIDLTGPVRQHILKHLPHLSVAPADGLDAPLPSPPREGIPLPYPPSRADRGTGDIWSDLGTLIPLSEAARPSEGHNASGSSTKLESRDRGDNRDESGKGSNIPTPSDLGSCLSLEANAIQNNELDVNDGLSDGEGKAASVLLNPPPSEGDPLIWHDIALSIGASLMLRMRDEVKRRLGYTTSAGIARNKFLAKLAASYKKRDNQTILRNAAIPYYLRPLPFQKIRFLGGKLGAAIAEEYDAQTVGDLLCVGIDEMQRKFGESSIWVWEVLRGIDRSEVKEKPSMTKSMGASKNLQHPITHPSEGAHWLRILAGELAFRLIEAREENAGLWPKTLVLSIRRSYEASQSRQAPFPFTRTVTTDYICKAAEKLWVELVGTGPEYDRRRAKGHVSGMKITNVFLGFSGVEAMATGQRNIEGFFSPNGKKRKVKDVSDGVGDDDGKRKKFNSVDESDQAMSCDSPLSLDAVPKSELSFRCPRCGEELQQTANELTDGEAALRKLMMEHEDFHFAQDLAREHDGNRGSTSGSHGGTPKKPQKDKRKGIAKFFDPAPRKKT